MARRPDEANPPPSSLEGGGPATTEERVIDSLLEGLDAPQPMVRTRTGRPFNAPETTPALPLTGDRRAPTALLPAVEAQKKRRATFLAAVLGILAVGGAIAIVQRPNAAPPMASEATKANEATETDGQRRAKNANVAAAVDLSSNHQMNMAGSSAALATATATATAPMPTVSLSALPSVPAATATATSERPRPPAHASSGSGNHAEIREDSL